MVATTLPTEADIFEHTEKLLCQWGDETRAHNERLGYPSSSPISRMIQQQRVFPRGVRRKRAHRGVVLRERDVGAAQKCGCGRVFIGDHCPRCSGAERVTGRETRSMQPRLSVDFSSATLAIEAIVVDAPGWMQRALCRRYLFRQPDRGAAQDLRMRETRYREELKAAVEYVARGLATRRADAYLQARI